MLFMFTVEGGVEIEEVAAEKPEALARLHVDPLEGFQPYQARRLIYGAGVEDESEQKQIAAIVQRLYQCFVETDAMLCEINPLIVTPDGEVRALDSKFTVDDNALYKHPDIAEMRDPEAYPPEERAAREKGVTYVKLDGDVGILGNGAGLVMSTLDVIALVGGRPANFCDLGGEWCDPGEGVKALDVATGGGHVARRLREEGCSVVTLDPSPGMQPDVIASAETIPFEDSSFDVVVSRIAPHHFEDVGAAFAEMARVSKRLVVIEDTLYSSDRQEEAEKLRDPTHVRNYTEDEWRTFLTAAGLEVEQVEYFEKTHPLEAWLARTGCMGAEAERVRELLADRMTADGSAWIDTKLIIRARKTGS